MNKNRNEQNLHSKPQPGRAEGDLESLLDLPIGDANGQEGPYSDASEAPIDSHGIASARERRKLANPSRPVSKWWVVAALALIGGGVAVYYFGAGAPVIQSGPARLQFEALRVGNATGSSKVELVNVGKRMLRISEMEMIGSAVDQFSIPGENCVGAELKPGETCEVEFLFAPTVMGISSVNLAIRSNAREKLFQLAVSGEGVAPRIGVDRRAINFGLQPVAQGSKADEIVISNLGSAPLQLQRTSITGESVKDFVRTSDTCRARTLDPGDHCQFRITFKPQAAGLRSAEVWIPSDSIEALSPILLTGTGELRGSSLTVEPSQLEFNLQLKGAGGESKSFRVTNRGLDPIAFRPIRLSDEGESFTIVGEKCTERRLAPAESCLVEVSFQPSQVGRLTSVVHVSNIEETEILAVPMSGVGAEPKIVLQPSEMDFGEVRVNQGESFRELRVHNEGEWPATIDEVSLGSVGGSEFGIMEDICSGATLVPSAGCAIRLVFGPTTAGTNTAELQVEWQTQISRSAEMLRLFGSGTAPQLEISSTKIDFGGVAATQTADRRLTLTNTGSAPLNLSGIFLEESGRLAFERRGGDCDNGQILSPKTDCDVMIRFVPAVPEGPRTASIVIQSDSSPTTTRVDLVGFALPRPIPKIAVEPVRLDFEPVEVGGRSDIQTLTVENSGSGVLRFGKLDVGGPFPEDFKLVPGSCQGADTLAPKSKCTIGLRFTPLGEGARQAVLRIRHNALGDTTTVELLGEGIVRADAAPINSPSALP